MKARVGGLLRKLVPSTSPWRPAGAVYPALQTLDLTPLMGQSGIYALWHLGVRPRWLRTGGAGDLAAVLSRLRGLADIQSADVHGGVYVAWALLPLSAIAAAIGALSEPLKPYLQALDIPGEIKAGKPSGAFPLPPGTGSVHGGG